MSYNYRIDTDSSGPSVADETKKLIEEAIDSNEKKIIINMSLEKSQEEISRLEKELMSNIKDLAKKIKGIIASHHRDFCTAFTRFMSEAKKDLKEKIEEMERVQYKKTYLFDVNAVIVERDYYKKEAIRLNEVCKKLKLNLENTTRNFGVLSEELMAVTNKWKGSEMINKQLVKEFNNITDYHKQLEKEVDKMSSIANLNNSNSTNIQSNFMKNNSSNINNSISNNTNNMNDLSSNRNYMNIEDSYNINLHSDRTEKYIQLIEKYKSDLNKEKLKNSKLSCKLYSITNEKNRLESIFIDCIDECRKNIFNRKIKDKYGFKKFLNSSSINNININVNYDSFMADDKISLLEQFVYNDEVTAFIKEYMFNKNKNEEKNQENKSILEKINLSEKDLKKISLFGTNKMANIYSINLFNNSVKGTRSVFPAIKKNKYKIIKSNSMSKVDCTFGYPRNIKESAD